MLLTCRVVVSVSATGIRAPLTATILILELTGRLDLAAPLGLVTAGSALVATLLADAPPVAVSSSRNISKPLQASVADLKRRSEPAVLSVAALLSQVWVWVRRVGHKP